MYVMLSKCTPCCQKVGHDFKMYAITSKLCHEVKNYVKSYVKYAWCQKVCHDNKVHHIYIYIYSFKKYLITPKSTSWYQKYLFMYVTKSKSIWKNTIKGTHWRKTPVALNQYTWVNRTRKHFLYMLQGHMEILK